MTERDRTEDQRLDEPVAQTPEPDESDVEGHSMLLYEQARNHARDRGREVDDWARKEFLRKEAHDRKPERR